MTHFEPDSLLCSRERECHGPEDSRTLRPGTGRRRDCPQRERIEVNSAVREQEDGEPLASVKDSYDMRQDVSARTKGEGPAHELTRPDVLRLGRILGSKGIPIGEELLGIDTLDDVCAVAAVRNRLGNLQSLHVRRGFRRTHGACRNHRDYRQSDRARPLGRRLSGR